MELTFKQLERLLRWHFGVGEEGEKAFRGRIQHLQRAKVPAGVNTGKGRAAVYGWSQIIELMTVLDLIDIGLSPEAARNVVSYNLKTLFGHAASFAANVPDEVFGKWIENERCSPEHTLVISASAGVLHALTGGADYIFECYSGDDFLQSLADEESYRPASCTLNISKRLLSTLNDLRFVVFGLENLPQGMKNIIGSFRNWAFLVVQGEA